MSGRSLGLSMAVSVVCARRRCATGFLGQSYLDGQGHIVLIHPKTATFVQPLPVFEFPKILGLRLWVLPFCLQSRRLAIPNDAPFVDAFTDRCPVDAADAWLSTDD